MSTMLIECPNCAAQAQVDRSKSGAKVRCGGCQTVYVAEAVAPAPRARAGAARGASKNTSKPIAIAVGVGCLLVVGLLVVRGGSAKKPIADPTPVVEAKAPAPAIISGWDAPAIKAARTVHDAANRGERAILLDMIHGESAWEWKRSAPVEEGGEPQVPAPYASLNPLERSTFLEELVDELISGEGKDLVADWKPYDGTIIDETDASAVVRLDVTPRGQGSEKRTVEWSLVKEGSRWRVGTWRRYLTPEELAAARRERSRRIKKVTLSDGSVVVESEPGPIDHFADTPPELRTRIDTLYATMIDLERSPKENAAALADLVAIGKPALPVLLTGLYITPLETNEQAMQVNLINQGLEQITGIFTGYKPQVAVGSGTGTSEERRQSAIRQWFGWWELKGAKFEKRSDADALDDALQPQNEREQWELERAKKQLEREANRRE